MTDLVIDASVSRAAGTTAAPASTRCHEFLEAILITKVTWVLAGALAEQSRTLGHAATLG